MECTLFKHQTLPRVFQVIIQQNNNKIKNKETSYKLNCGTAIFLVMAVLTAYSNWLDRGDNPRVLNWVSSLYSIVALRTLIRMWSCGWELTCEDVKTSSFTLGDLFLQMSLLIDGVLHCKRSQSEDNCWNGKFKCILLETLSWSPLKM